MNALSSKNKKILVFPAGMPKAIEYAKHVVDAELIGASSVKSDPAREHFDNWEQLPYVNDSLFPEAMKSLIIKHGITHIFSPHQVVWYYLHENLQTLVTNVELINRAPLEEGLSGYYDALDYAKSGFSNLCLQSSLTPKEDLSDIEKAALYRNFTLVPGECDFNKLNGFYQALKQCPDGDIVEIGSLWGRSAFILSFLAQRWEIGNVLCIDPWSTEFKEESAYVNDSYGAYHTISDALLFFQINLTVFRGRVNFIHGASDDAAKEYKAGLVLDNDVMGVVSYQGHIAVLHIDGNHTYPCVKSDIDSWADNVVPGGWIVIDDYVWCFGDGPQRAADEYLAKNIDLLESAFVIGGALFIQKKIS